MKWGEAGGGRDQGGGLAGRQGEGGGGGGVQEVRVYSTV
jgi:hypothetical protein